MATPWFEPTTVGLLGALIGGLGGAAGILGGLAGSLAPRGVGRRWILGAWMFFIAAGALLLAVGLLALLAGQPFWIAWPFLASGAGLGGLMSMLLPMIRRRYEEAEERRITAEALRRS